MFLAGRIVVSNSRSQSPAKARSLYTFAPLGLTDMGDTFQVASVIAAGSAQLKLTVWLNPPCGATESVNVAEPPAVTVAEGWLGDTA